MPHTPGPWKVERQFRDGMETVPRITCDPSPERECGRIADAVGAPYLAYGSTLPNAYLIAAAPDMLAVLEGIAASQGHINDNSLWMALLAAISKAKGK